ncbi:SDR family oxidoreductase [Cohnella fermenti]|uniref:SDR family oxidoreductase n=2 Tax=Cohnella fermenti TaxID=2565925 RepID=A0A4S4BRA6_9BACL|nr:SDR family oxidoreductase [Cohnella fermenti]
MELFRLDSKVAVVTGGSGLYGAHISAALAQAGAAVVIASRGVAECEALAAKLRGEGADAVALPLDLGDEASIQSFVAQTLERCGRIDILVNNAVSRVGLADLEQTEAGGWSAAEQVNGLGTMLLTKAVVPSMRERREGNIINISSIQGILGPNFPVYGNTGRTSGIEYTYNKWGLVGMTKWLANYYGPYNIRVNSISPGGYNPSGALEDDNDEFLRNYKVRTPLGRMADDDDIKGAVVYLASRASSYITGHNLVMDGGWSNW